MTTEIRPDNEREQQWAGVLAELAELNEIADELTRCRTIAEQATA